MGISAGTVWEVRADGSDTNGGLCLSTQPGFGADYSQQAAAQLSLSDVVTNGTTTVTSVTGGFTSVMPGNGINIAGTCYMIATFGNTNTITVDRTIGAASGQTGKVGGALGTPGFASGQAVSTNKIWIKAGTYTNTTATTNVAGGCVQPAGGSQGFPFVVEGYQTTRGDKGTKPVLDDGGFASALVLYGQAGYTVFDNIATVVNGTSAIGVYLGAANCMAIRCKASGTKLGIYLDAFDTYAMLCEAAVTGAVGITINSTGSIFDCISHGSSTDGIQIDGDYATVSRCISYGNTGIGFQSNTKVTNFINCVAYGNSSDGFRVSQGGAYNGDVCINCIAMNNGGYGFSALTSNAYLRLMYCATRGNTSGATHNLPTTEGAVTLSGDPFTNAASGDFSLNATSGAGAACRAAGIPGAFPAGLSTGYLDIGAVQHADPAAPTYPAASSVYSGVDRGDGVLGTLHGSNIATAAGSGSNLSAGILKSGSVVDNVTGTYAAGGGGGGRLSLSL